MVPATARLAAAARHRQRGRRAGDWQGNATRDDSFDRGICRSVARFKSGALAEFSPSLKGFLHPVLNGDGARVFLTVIIVGRHGDSFRSRIQDVRRGDIVCPVKNRQVLSGTGRERRVEVKPQVYADLSPQHRCCAGVSLPPHLRPTAGLLFVFADCGRQGRPSVSGFDGIRRPAPNGTTQSMGRSTNEWPREQMRHANHVERPPACQCRTISRDSDASPAADRLVSAIGSREPSDRR